MRLSIVVGARSEFVQAAALLRVVRGRNFELRIVYAGRHSDDQLGRTFFEDLHLPEPDADLGVGAGPHVWQTAEIMRRLAHEFLNHPPQRLLLVGDSNATLASALTASKLGVPTARLEAGLRTFDRTQPDEINRVTADSFASWLFTSERSAETNLLNEGLPRERIYAAGNVAIDTLLGHLDCARSLPLHAQFGLTARHYAVLRLSRRSNIHNRDRLAAILQAVQQIAGELPILFPVHPQIRQRLEEFGLAENSDRDGLLAIDPQGYLATLHLMDGAALVLTDTGPVQDEALVLQVPCLTLGHNTERVSSLHAGGNRLVGWHTEDIVQAVRAVLRDSRSQATVPGDWDGRAAERVVSILLEDPGSPPRPFSRSTAAVS